jgi:cold shock CspA family protein
MGRPKETFNKREREKKKAQKRKEKEQRKEERKENAHEKQSLDDMIAYVDEYGNITSTPPDPSKKKEVRAESIEIGVPPSTGAPRNAPRSGKVKFFDNRKGYGFIEDEESGESIFVHVNDLKQPINENDRVMFKTARGFKGLNAVEVEVVK